MTTSDNLGPADGLPSWAATDADPLTVGQVSCGCWRCEGRPDDGTLHATVERTADILALAFALGFLAGRLV